VVEGHGETAAVPLLCHKVLEILEAWTWFVDPDPIRQPRASLVKAGRPNDAGMTRAVRLARARPADAVLVVCDADDDCPVAWGPAGELIVTRVLTGACVMASREYESWLLAARLDTSKLGARRIEEIRGAKERFKVEWPGYKPHVDQLAATREIDVVRLRSLAPSFDKLVRSLEKIVGVPAR